MTVSGILNLCKPVGCTSFDMVKRIRRLSGEKKVGHGGTLDPLASGVLPICLGRATRVSEFLADSSKSYRAVMKFGAATDTYDAEGTITEEHDPSHLTLEKVEDSLGPFRGIILQEPPMYSALKHEGKRLYELAREGITIERPKRETAVHKLQILNWDPPLATIYVDCGRGTYVRSLAHDIGQELGVGAHLTELVRLRTGPFDVSESVTPEAFEKAVESGRWKDLLFPIDFALSNMPAAVLDKRAERATSNGQPIPVSYLDYDKISTAAAQLSSAYREPGELILSRAYSQEGRFLAVISAPTPRGPWSPKRVFAPQNQ